MSAVYRLRAGVLLAVFTGLLCAFAVSAVSADASEVTPLTFEKFSVQTTKETKLVEPRENGPTNIENVPYTFTQAGGHPWGLTTTGVFVTEKTTSKHGAVIAAPTRDPKDIVVDLPPGLVGNPQVVPRCPVTVYLSPDARCPTDTQLGVVRLRWYGGQETLAPIVNLVPEAGQSAEFGLENMPSK